MSTTPTSERTPDVTKPVGRNRRWLWVVALIAMIAIAVGAVVAVLASGDGGEAPEDVVAQYIEAFDARDLDAVGAVFDPEIVYVYDASQIGMAEFNTEIIGREAVLENTEEVWLEWGPTMESYEVLAVDGGTVTTTQNVTFSNGARFQHSVVYQVSDDDLIVLEERVAEQQLDDPSG